MKSIFNIFHGTKTVDENGVQHVSNFRRILPQVCSSLCEAQTIYLFSSLFSRFRCSGPWQKVS